MIETTKTEVTTTYEYDDEGRTAKVTTVQEVTTNTQEDSQ